MARDPEQFDGILMAMAQQHEGGVQELLETIFSFLARKTDFYTGASVSTARKLVLDKFEKFQGDALEAEKKKKKDLEEAEKKRKARAEKERQQLEKESQQRDVEASSIQELTEEEAEKLQKELDAKAGNKSEEKGDGDGLSKVVSGDPAGGTKDEDDEEEDEKGMILL
ncbi:Nuclear migration protein nudC [Orchesella cincta]|uniref:Nuclear migration protein nudC n=1 Tax=Orchesella cincta TaxID=48709 RepID=A0A1D2MS69_ORCCI|nr:Nuclear migration protein nudC [Orchesella cincta]